ncbi:MAG TPA: EF-hand domain-containing protein [Thermoanaerobaculia bacterium]|nr:EF-hand domain-containing protein [Thermoanaerobaculia bacterium]
MCSRNRFLFLVLLSLALPAGAWAQDEPKDKDPKKAAPKEANPYEERFKQLDQNGDGFVSIEEWPLDRPSFERVDRNQDGRLSRGELLTPNTLRRDRVDVEFDELDVNRDGYLSQSERRRGGAGLERLDKNRDGAVSRLEYQRVENLWNPRVSGRDQRLFRQLDRNNDNRLTRTEVAGTGARFDALDRNRDGVISPREWP